jgi:hypothetical protein
VLAHDIAGLLTKSRRSRAQLGAALEKVKALTIAMLCFLCAMTVWHAEFRAHDGRTPTGAPLALVPEPMAATVRDKHLFRFILLLGKLDGG